MPGTDGMSIVVTENGPYEVSGAVPISRQTIVADAEGNSIAWQEGERLETRPRYLLCRCGHSANKPYCDNSHIAFGFDGTETASRAGYLEQAVEQDGPTVTLTDASALCAFARFCDYGGQVWNLVEQDSPEAADLTVKEAGLCPSGRLVAWDLRAREAIEPPYPPSIGLVEDPQQRVAGPLWVRGGIPVVSADGTAYERRNRVTLCRCGGSRNKPFCDGTHASIGFVDTPDTPTSRP